MEKIRGLLCVFLVISIFNTVLLVGCTSKPSGRFGGREGISADFPKNRQFQFNKSMNLTEEDRQEMMEERQQLAIEVCKDKNEGDACQLQTHMNESSGICKIMDKNLVCTIDRLMGQR